MSSAADHFHFTPWKARLLPFIGLVLLLAELARWPGHIVAYRHEGIPSGPGDVVALVLTSVFTIQLMRGRWSLGALIYVAIYSLLQIMIVLSFSLEASEGMPSRYTAFLTMAPYITQHVVALAGIAYARWHCPRESLAT